MKLTGTYTFDVPAENVWESLMDPTQLATVIPGCEALQQIGPDEYKADLKIRVGPVQSQFNGRIKIMEKSGQESFNLLLTGSGPSGTVDGKGSVHLTPQNGSTVLAYDGEAQVGGRIATVGSRILTSTAKAITQQSLDGLHERLTQPASTIMQTNGNGTVASASSAPAPQQSQAEFAAAVVRDVYDDLVPPAVRPVVTVGIVAGAILLIQWWISFTVERAVDRALAKRQ